MKNIIKLLAVGVVLTAALFVPSAYATSESTDCTTVPDGNSGSNYQMQQYFSVSFSRSGDTGTATVSLKSGVKKLCKDQPMVLQSFNMGPNWNGGPDSHDSFITSLPQTMAYATHFTFGKDQTSKTVTVKTPSECDGTQLDVYVGDQEVPKVVGEHDGERREIGGKIFQGIECKEEVKVKVCNPKTGEIISVPESEAGKYEPADSDNCKVKVCDPSSGNLILVPKEDKDKYEPVDSAKCKVKVCDASTGTIKLVPKEDAGKYEPADSDKCVKIEVCVKGSGDTTMKTITKDQFDSSKHSTNADDCKAPVVTPPVTLPSTGPGEIIGGIAGVSSLSYGGYSYLRSRRNLLSLFRRS